MQVLVDRPMIEICGNDGAVCITSGREHRGDVQQIKAFAEGGTARLVRLEVFELQSIWETDKSARFDPVQRQIEGWTVHIDPALLDGVHQEEGTRAVAMLANHLQRIRILVPTAALEKLQDVEIWIEHDHPRLKGMQYHPTREWLNEHGHDPRLTRKVHIPQASQLLSREQMLKHPAVVLHELAHGYHHQVLGFDDPEVIRVFKQAVESGNYEDVLLYTSQSVRHYGLTDHKEYFAEGTEAFFYRNDFYPFVRAELKQHDPALHDLLQKIWIGE